MNEFMAVMLFMLLIGAAIFGICFIIFIVKLFSVLEGMASNLKTLNGNIASYLAKQKEQTAEKATQKEAPVSPAKQPEPSAAAVTEAVKPVPMPCRAPEKGSVSEILKTTAEKLAPAPVCTPVVPIEAESEVAVWKTEPVTEKQKTVEPTKIPPAVQKTVEAVKPAVPPVAKKIEKNVQKPSEFEAKFNETLSRIWKWIIVGDEAKGKKMSFEYAFASTWLIRISIVIILTGMIFLLRYSIVNNYIGPLGRVILSALGAGALMGGGIMLIRNKYRIIAQGLLGGSIAAFYFTVYAASNMYHLVNPGFAFCLMGLITAGACVMSLYFDTLLMALLGTAGGYLTPVMLSTGQKDFDGLFIYMTILGLGLLWVARNRNWIILNVMSLGLTYIIFLAAYDRFYDKTTDFPLVFTFLCIFFLVFSFVPVLYRIYIRRTTTLIESLLLFANAAIFFSIANWMIMQTYDNKEYCAILSACLAVFYIIQAAYMVLRKIDDPNLFKINFGFAAFFASLAVPLYFTKEVITISWSLQALVFLFLGIKFKSRFLKTISAILYILASFRLIGLDFCSSFEGLTPEIYWNTLPSRVLNFGIYIASIVSAYKLISKENSLLKSETGKGGGEGVHTLNAVICGGAFALGIIYLHFEAGGFAVTVYPPMEMTLLSFVWFGAIIGALVLYARTKVSAWLAPAILLFILLPFKMLLFDTEYLYSADIFRLTFNYHFTRHELLLNSLNFTGLILTSMFALKLFSQDREKFVFIRKLIITEALIMLFAYLTAETSTCLSYFVPGLNAGGISVLWGIYALGLIICGIVRRIRAVRYAGLALFFLTSVKIFFVDLASLTPLWRIISFITLGLIILLAAFAYVRFQDMFSEKANDKEPPV